MDEGGPLLVFIFGPVAVGKMTVGQEISRLTGMPLFFNHQLIDLIKPVLPFGSPGFRRTADAFNSRFYEEAAVSGARLIATWGWRFNLPSDNESAARYVAPFRRLGRVCFVELAADLETRLARNRTENRARHKELEWATDEELRALEADQWNSGGSFPLPETPLLIDNGAMSAAGAAARIAEHFGLPVVERA